MKTTLRLLCPILILVCANFSYSASFINGISVHSELGQESFIGALFTTNLSNNSREILLSQENKQIQVRVLANRLSSRRFKRMWIEGLAINASASELQSQSKNMAEFSNMLKVSLRRGDIFAVQRRSESVKVIINGATLGEINDPAFFDLLLRTWIGPVPLSSDFRQGLLAGGEYDNELQNRFNDTTPSESRITAVAAALKSSQTAPQAKTQQPAVAIQTTAPKIEAPTLIKPPALIKAPEPIVAAAPAPSVSPPAPSASAELDTNTDTQAASEQTQETATQEIAQSSEQVPEEVIAPVEQDTSELATTELSEAALSEQSFEDIIEEDDEEFTAESLLTQQLYIASLKKWTYQELVYPQFSLSRGEQGTIRLYVTVDREGKVENIEVTEASRHKRLTKAAIKAVNKSSPYPSMPDEVQGENFSFSLPIVFKIVEG